MRICRADSITLYCPPRFLDRHSHCGHLENFPHSSRKLGLTANILEFKITHQTRSTSRNSVLNSLAVHNSIEVVRAGSVMYLIHSRDINFGLKFKQKRNSFERLCIYVRHSLVEPK